MRTGLLNTAINLIDRLLKALVLRLDADMIVEVSEINDLWVAEALFLLSVLVIRTLDIKKDSTEELPLFY